MLRNLLRLFHWHFSFAIVVAVVMIVVVVVVVAAVLDYAPKFSTVLSLRPFEFHASLFGSSAST